MITKPEKYTRKFVLLELSNMLSAIKEQDDLIVLGELFSDRDYSPQRFSEWEDKFSDDEEISESIKRIKSIFETRLNIGGLKGKFNPTMTIFNLKNNYGWKDKTEQEISNPDGSLTPTVRIIDERPKKQE